MSPTEQSQTWMLFENSEYAKVELSLHAPPPDSSRPVDAYVVTEHGGFAGSAQRAAEAVYGWLDKRGMKKKQFVAGFDLSGLSSGPVTGESGGLAFAVALAAKLLDQPWGVVAATGVITSGHGDGPVGQVRGIEAKLNSAVQLVPENGVIFYPAANECEISGELRNTIVQKGIRLQPVSSVTQALDILFNKLQDEKTATDNVSPGKGLFILTAVLFFAALLLIIFLVMDEKNSGDVSLAPPPLSDVQKTKVTEPASENPTQAASVEQAALKIVEEDKQKPAIETLKGSEPVTFPDSKGFE